ncbi:MAG: IclR family transcriptional regulator [Actinomycetota bacterium]|nr:IclR family transcriptional regulator [Actinomycetota bacterium]
MEHLSGVGVLDKSVLVLNAVQDGARSLAELTAHTGLSRATAHRLAVALETHRLLCRDVQARWHLGPRLGELAAATAVDPLLDGAAPILRELREATGESAQLYRRHGESRLCVATAERVSGLRDTVPVGSVLPMTAGSAAQVLSAWAAEGRPLAGSAFGVRALAEVRRRGWAHSVGEREQGVASVSAPVRDVRGDVVAAVSVSGPLDRLTRSPGRLHSAAVLRAAAALELLLKPAEGVKTD